MAININRVETFERKTISLYSISQGEPFQLKDQLHRGPFIKIVLPKEVLGELDADGYKTFLVFDFSIKSWDIMEQCTVLPVDIEMEVTPQFWAQ